MTLDEFADTMDARAARIPKIVSDAAASTALVIVSDLAYSTPVDTSQALSSWFVTIGQSATAIGQPHFAGVEGSTQDESAQATINLAITVLGTKQPGQPIFITNNQPYIERLNAGYSKQQPAGFVERAILIARNALARFKINW